MHNLTREKIKEKFLINKVDRKIRGYDKTSEKHFKSSKLSIYDNYADDSSLFSCNLINLY